MLRENSVVNVYVDPVTRFKLIGVAKLVRFVESFEMEGVIIERWHICYLNEPDTLYTMYINGGAA